MKKALWTLIVCPVCGLELPFECEHIRNGTSQLRPQEVVPVEVVKTMDAVHAVERENLRDHLIWTLGWIRQCRDIPIPDEPEEWQHWKTACEAVGVSVERHYR